MANRSDFYKAKLPRGFKRMLAMEETNGWINSPQERNAIKDIFIKAHANHVAFKMKRNAAETRDVTDEA
jgi:hypothetical protein